MHFDKVQIASIILNTYKDSWFVWLFLFIIGVLLFLYADKISTSKRKYNRKTNAGIELIALFIVIHIAVIWSLFQQ